MELDSDEERNQLLRESAKHRQALKGEVNLISENTEKIITNALVIGGSLAISYYLVRQFSGSKKSGKAKNKKVKYIQADRPELVEVERETSHEPGILGQVGTALATQASVFLLNLAKEKLMEFMQSLQEKKQQDQ